MCIEKPKELKRVASQIKHFCKPLGSPKVKIMCIPVLFSLLAGGKMRAAVCRMIVVM